MSALRLVKLRESNVNYTKELQLNKPLVCSSAFVGKGGKTPCEHYRYKHET